MDFGLLVDKKNGFLRNNFKFMYKFFFLEYKLDSYKRKDKNVEIYFN